MNTKRKKIIFIGLAVLMAIVVAMLAVYLFYYMKGNRANVDWYNEYREEFVIGTADELYEFQKLSNFYNFEGQTIKLDADIVVNEGDASEWDEEAPKRKWYPIKRFAGTFDGQGHTISGLYGSGVSIHMGLFSNTSEECVIKNFKLVNSYFKSVGGMGVGSISSHGGGTFEQIYSDAIIECRGANIAGIIGRVRRDTTISECWYDGQISGNRDRIGGIAGIMEKGVLNIEHSLYSGSITSPYTDGGIRMGGLCATVAEAGCTLNITDSLSCGVIGTKKSLAGSVLGVYEAGTKVNAESAWGLIEGTTPCIGVGGARGTMNGVAMEIYADNLKGHLAYQWTNLDFHKYWAVVVGDTPVLQCFAEEVPSTAGLSKFYNLDWYDKDKKEYTLHTAEDLYGFAMLSSGIDFKGKTIYLGSDIVVNEGDAKDWAEEAPKKQWNPIKSFAGTFDGQGHTISGIYLSSEGQKTGLFSETTDTSIVKNFKLVNSYIENTTTKTAMTASIIGSTSGSLDSVYSNAIVVSSGNVTGGLIGQLTGVGDHMITNCWFDGKLQMKGENGRYAGGLVAYVAKGTTTIDNCLNTASISCEATLAGSHVGGFVATTINGATTLHIKNSLSAGVITTINKNQVASIIGRIQSGTKVNFDNVYATEESYEKTVGYVDGGTQTGDAVVYKESQLYGIGGYQWTALDFDKYWAAVSNDTPELKSFTTEAVALTNVSRKVDISWYKADAKTYTLKTPEQLYGFFVLSASTDFAGKTVRLGSDITLNKGTASSWARTAPENPWTPIKKFAGTFDGRGHTISGIYVNTNKTGAGFFGETLKGSVVKNLRITNSYFRSNVAEGKDALIGSVAGKGCGTFSDIYSDAIIVSSGYRAGGLIGSIDAEGKHLISNCWYDGTIQMKGEGGRYGAGIVAEVSKGTVTIEHCLSTADISCEATKSGSHIAGITASTKGAGTVLNLTDCLIAGSIDVAKHTQVASAIGRIQEKTTVNFKDVYATAECHEKTVGYVEDATQNGDAIVLEEAVLKGYGGYQWTQLNFKEYWAVVMEGTPVLQSFATTVPSLAGVARLIDTSWYDATASTYTIDSTEDLFGLYLLSASTDFAGKTVKLGADITVNEGDASGWAQSAPQKRWNPVKKFAGTFDGQGHTIRGIYVNTDKKGAGLFAATTGASVVKNLKLTNSYFESSVKAGEDAILGSIVGEGAGTFENIYSDAIVVSSGYHAGGLIGYMNTSGNHRIRNCWFDGSLQMKGEGGRYGAGIVALVAKGTVSIEHCLNTGSISGEAVKEGSHISGLVASTKTDGTELIIKDCLSVGAITVKNKSQVASVIGRIQSNTSVELEDVFATVESYAKTVGYVEGTQSGTVTQLPQTSLLGTQGYIATTLDFANYWAAIKNDTPELKSFAKGETLDITGISRGDTSWYDPAVTTYVLDSADDLYGFYKISLTTDFAGKTVTLGADIVVNTGDAKNWFTNAPEKRWNSIKKFAGTFDGQGHTISGLYMTTSMTGAGMFSETTADSCIKNFQLKNSYFSTSVSGYDNAYLGSVVGIGAGTFENIYSDAYVVSCGYRVGGLIGTITAAGNHKISNCWYDGELKLTGEDGRYAGGLVGEIKAGNTTIEHCLVTKSITCEAKNAGSHIGGFVAKVMSSGTTVTVKDSLMTGSITVKNTDQVGSVVGYLAEQSVMNFERVYAATESYEKTVGTVWEATQNGEISQIATDDMKDIAAYYLLSLDFYDYWTPVKNGTPQLKSFVKGDAINTTYIVKEDTDWYNPDASEKAYTITRLNEFYGFATLSQTTTFDGWTIKLGADIKANDTSASKWWESAQNEWTPIGNENYKFAGTFDGKGHTISGIYLSTDAKKSGLFYATQAGSTIKDFKLTDSYFKFDKLYENAYLGSVVGEGAGTFEKIYSNATIVSNGYHNGGLIGYIAAAGTHRITNCWYDGTMTLTEDGKRTGGLVAWIEAGTTTIEHCLSTAIINGEASGAQYTGGIVGNVKNAATVVNLTDVLSVGSITTAVSNQVGAVIGAIDGATVNCTNVYNTTECYFRPVGDNWGTMTGVIGSKSKDLLKGADGEENTELDFETYWIAVKESTPELKDFVKGEPVTAQALLRAVKDILQNLTK